MALQTATRIDRRQMLMKDQLLLNIQQATYVMIGQTSTLLCVLYDFSSLDGDPPLTPGRNGLVVRHQNQRGA